MKYIIRILILPFVMGITLAGLLILWIKQMINFIKVGGEFIVYTQQMDRKTIEDVFKKLIENDRKRNN
jgi:hypothetical protein